MGIKINQVIQEAEARKAAAPPMPQVKSRQSVPTDESNKSIAIPSRDATIVTGKDALLKDLYDELAQVKRDRSTLSSGTPAMVARIREHLASESKVIAEEFMKGNVPAAELQEHYSRIQACTDRAIRLADQIKHVEKYGELPIEREVSLSSDIDNIGALKIQLIKLKDLISKTKKKLAGGTAKNPARIVMWQEKLDHATAQRNEVWEKIKRIQGDVRNSDYSKVEKASQGGA